jgi:cytochrome c peroxidase
LTFYRKTDWKQFAGLGVLLAATMYAAPVDQPGIFPPDKPPLPGSLKQIPVPLPPNLGDFVVDRNAAIILGKAFFWDMQTGSDGLGCASCHFHAGADNRVKNQLSPGLRNEQGGAVSQTFNVTATHKGQKIGPPPGGGPNYTLTTADFPFHQLADPLDRNSAVTFDTDDVVSSQGVFRRDFVSLLPAPKKQEVCNIAPTFFDVHGVNVRQVEPRNTPTVINAVYNFRNFWDGRANNIFNGRNPFGPRDPSAGIDPLNSVLVADGLGRLSPMIVQIPDASLASQAVGPPQSNFEMSCAGRVFEQIGQKLLRLKPLAGQTVDPTDSVLGPYANKTAAGGVTFDYPTMIKKAFQPKFWSSNQATADGYAQIEKNFSLFWGLAIMMYESTLITDKSPFDQYMDGNIGALTQQQLDGFQQVYANKGGCIFCHKGPEFTGAASSLRNAKDLGAQIEHMIMGDGNVSMYDSGFYNIGVRVPVEDIGIGGLDPWGNPLSWARQAKKASMATGPAINLINVAPDLFNTFTCNFQVDACIAVDPSFRDSVDGSFKVPSLRNVELTGPYFHNGGQATLEQVVDFYNRGGDGRGTDAINTTGYKQNLTNRAPAIFPLGLTATDKANLVAFLKSLTDDRVRWESAPFDHPSLKIPNGHPVSENAAIPSGPIKQAIDDYVDIPAVGAAGRAAKKLPPIGPFDPNNTKF